MKPMSPDIVLQRMYTGTRRAFVGSPRERGIRTPECVEEALKDVDELIRDRAPENLDLLLSRMQVDQVHSEVLDAILTLLEDMILPSLNAFRDRVSGRLAKVDELIKPIILRRSYGQTHSGGAVRGEIISHDVRRDARAIYREKAKMFGDALRRDGNLDKFYKTAGSKI